MGGPAMQALPAHAQTAMTRWHPTRSRPQAIHVSHCCPASIIALCERDRAQLLLLELGCSFTQTPMTLSLWSSVQAFIHVFAAP